MARNFPIRLRTLAASAVVIASGLLIFNAYQSIINSTDGNLQALPIIVADKSPFRESPLNPGGADIPNQGSLLFNVLSENNSDSLALGGLKITETEDEPTTILIEDSDDEISGFELPTVPEKKVESLYGIIEDLKEKKENVIEEVVEETLEKVKIAEIVKPVEIKKSIITPIKKPNVPSKKIVTKVEKKSREKKGFSLDRILTQEPLTKHFYIQLASLKNEDDARNSYNNIRDKFPKLVAGLSVFFPKVDLGKRGTFTRIQIGPLDNKEARKRCADYSTSMNGGTCLVISR